MPEQKISEEKAAWPIDNGSYSAINIGPEEQKKRFLGGLIIFGLTMAALAVFVSADIGRWWRLCLFPMYYMASLGYFEAKEKTCVILAIRGSCNLGNGREKIDDRHLIKILRFQAKKVYLKSLTAAILLAGLSLLIL